MNRDFAKQALLRGEKVHLDAWASNEYVYLKDNVVYDENNTLIPEFIKVMDTLPEFGWTIFVGKGNEEKPKRRKKHLSLNRLDLKTYSLHYVRT